MFHCCRYCGMDVPSMLFSGGRWLICRGSVASPDYLDETCGRPVPGVVQERHGRHGLAPSCHTPPLRSRIDPKEEEAAVAVAVRVRAKVTGAKDRRRRGEQERDLALALPPGPVTARQIIAAAVAAEVAAYQARAEEASLIRVLTDQALADDLDRGAVRMGDVARAGQVDVAAAVETALCAFDDGIVKVFVGDREAEGPVELADGADVLFLRLVPLAGG
jgi:hypothetical protein